ncbi:1-phosphofructokinase [Pseudomonas sp. RIT-PI-S]|uniref:1-phosphofructokinase n=1 Tax=Pseudomonas sp. RIT-PI-S TaxID=3035295 RepID=UPI0021D871BD|nr:1-phosphofructokinase [Pseudomonas sp. RIT-PI-S]
MARILTITLNPALDLTIELPTLRLGEVNRGEALHVHAAGKGLNVAQVLADLGHQLTVAGFLGSDNSERFEALFRQRGFIDAFIRVPGETRRNLKLAEHDGRVTDVNGAGLQVPAHAQAALLQRLAEIAPGHDLAIVAGSLPQGVSPQWLQQLLEALRALGLPVALDTSGAALRAGLACQPWLIKPNTEELAQVLDAPAEELQHQATAAKALHARGIEHVVISQGAQGVSWFTPGGAWHALPPTVAVASTVGAGDSLLAGMVHGLLSHASAESTLRTATAIAAMAVTQIGFGIPDHAALARLESGVHVSPMAAFAEVAQ